MSLLPIGTRQVPHPEDRGYGRILVHWTQIVHHFQIGILMHAQPEVVRVQEERMRGENAAAAIKEHIGTLVLERREPGVRGLRIVIPLQ